MKIISIMRNPRNIPVGVPSIFRVGNGEGTGVVIPAKQILFCRDGYANGPGKDPVFVVKYEDTSIVSQIPANEIVEVTVDTSETKGKKDKTTEASSTEAAVELPEQ